MRIVIYAIFLFSVIACSNGKANKIFNENIKKKSQTSLAENYSLPLDAETPIWNYYSQYAELNGKPKLIWFNPNRYSIDYFDIESQNLERKVVLEQNGPNAIPGMGLNSSIKFINEDTVIIYSGPLKKIFLTKISGEVYKKIDLSDEPYGFGSVTLDTSIAYRKGSIYMQLLTIIPEIIPENFNPKYNKIAKIDLGNGSVEAFEIDYPAVYSNENISQHLKMISLIYNEKADKFIISYPLSDELLVTDFKSGINRYPAKSDLVSEVIPIDPKNSEIEPSRIRTAYYWMNDSYEELIFDKENELYLRTVRKGITKEQLKNRNYKSDREILVLNKDFEQIGGFEFFSSGLNYYFFNGKRFFWEKDLQKFNLEDGVEDSIFFQSKVLDF